MSSIKLCGKDMDFERALIYNGQQLEFRLGGQIVGIKGIESKYINQKMRDVDVVSVIRSAGNIEVACMIDSEYDVFNIRNGELVNNLVKLDGFMLALYDNNKIEGINYSRIMLVFAQKFIRKNEIKRILGV